MEDGTRGAVTPEASRQRGNSLHLTLPPFSTGTTAYTLQFGSPEPASGNIYPFTSKSDQNFNPAMDWIFSPQGMIATLTNRDPVYRPLSLEVITAQSDTLIPLHSHDLKQWNTPPIPATILKNAALFISSKSDILTFFPQDYTMAFPSQESILASPEHDVELVMNGNSLFYSAIVWFQDQPAPSGNYFSPVWTFSPRALPFRDKAQIRVSLPQVAFPRRQLGIYFKNETQNWKYVPAEFSADSTVLTGDIYSLESFTLRRDSIPPVIHLLSPRSGGNYKASFLKKLAYRVFDGQTTIPDDEGIRLFLDEKQVIFGYNPNTNIVTYRLRDTLSPGSHTVRLVARDAAGNTTRRSYQFTVR